MVEKQYYKGKEFTSKLPFYCRKEALSFIRGVEFVNDSAVKIVGFNECGNNWWVYIYDESEVE